MALSDDQRALLRLLAQREEGYEDIAALMGLSVDEVRAVLSEGDDRRVKDVRAYERKHKARAGVIQATERELSKA